MKSITKQIFGCSVSLNYIDLSTSINKRSCRAIQTTTTSTNERSNKDNSSTTLTLHPLSFSSTSNVTVHSISAALTNFKDAKAYYRQKILEGNHELDHIYNGDPSVTNLFRRIFPELVKSRGITTLQQKDLDGKLFSRWKEAANDVTIELAEELHASASEVNEKQQISMKKHVDAVFVGGPSTLTACLLYKLRYPDHCIEHIFADRFDSNHDGSAFYYHERDAAPVYINRVNRGPYCIYITLYKSLISPKKLIDQAENNRQHVKISLNLSNIKLRHLFTIFIPNFWHMTTDLWIKNKKTSKIAHVIQHACRSVPIVHEISKHTGASVDKMLIHGKNKANYVGFAGSNTDPKTHFTWLNKFAYIPFHEISREGFGNEVTQVLNFPNDGLVAPMIIENLKKLIADSVQQFQPNKIHEVSQSCCQLKKLFVQPVVTDSQVRMRVTMIEYMNTITGINHRMPVNRVFISLGPSGQLKIVSPTLTLMQHAGMMIRRKSVSSSSVCITGGYKPTLPSLWRHILNDVSRGIFRGSQCLKDFIWASGSTSVILLGIDLNQVKPSQLDVFSRFIDGVNQHWTLIAQRDVSLSLTNHLKSSSRKTYRFFAIQMTGGGNFPSRLVRPDILLNLICTTEKMYGLDILKSAVYDIVQSRGCGRAVSAQNTISFQNLTDNAVINYALGGIGMTTMFSNGEKMVQMIEQTDDTLKTLDKKMTSTDRLLDHIDYSFMASHTQQLPKLMGFDNSMSKKEKIIALGSVFIHIVFTMQSNERNVITVKSLYSVKDTIDRIENDIKQQNGTIFCRIDQKKAAESVGIVGQLDDNELILFGNPRVGTQLMVANGSVSFELPLRASCWKENGIVYLSVTNPKALEIPYNLNSTHELLQKMTDNIIFMINKVSLL
ncbi:unnamed protein product [Adineta steineri]|uniref:DUF302 domain-containing protein n=1 Tax=Adineta steineri TaxID=433720 RepID=A0A813N8L1_9BILA|nr:unnamed protein product [Adineta steineri]CAF3931555.1 unnamed protein product [Adineta steineri]